MHPRLSVSALSSWNWSLDEDLAYWQQEGIDCVGLFLDKLLPDVAKAAQRISEAGLRVTNLACAGFQLHSPDTWAGRRAELAVALDAAATMQAESIFLTAGAAGSLTWEEAADRLNEAIDPLRTGAAARGIALALEHTSPLSAHIGFVHTLRDMVDLARQLHVGVIMEVNNCWAERGLGETIHNGVDVISLVQLDDYVLGTPCSPDRAVPGDGDIPLARILGSLHDAGYSGPFDLELVGPRIESEGYPSAIRRGVTATTQLLTDAGF
jgi:sugar phosphate isomerase/epimerase